MPDDEWCSKSFRHLFTLVAVVSSIHPTLCSAAVDVACSTTAGDFTIRLEEEWSPLGVRRFMDLVDSNFFDDQILYRVIPGFLMQFGVAADPRVMSKWATKTIRDEPKKHLPFKYGTVSFAGAGVDSRSCHIFIAFKPAGLTLGHAPHETPIGQVWANSLGVLDKIQANYKASGYGDLTNLQGEIGSLGNSAAANYPRLDRIKTCQRVEKVSSLLEEKEM
eukprot:gnl/MRDRNA2_/MRDRNA2_192423_c0_seq1.p1 gnl/MRDRNA2_/MRDRNA2_192423_c0~~gnl/MRDRNA2_/MRDRNA2_192423_c0_seq1.p1  ORF type:complete len:220 (+),score=18.92 gnl/MRDRNA2_/MRDRNA2_192423_c0_seq1:115-774(+)